MSRPKKFMDPLGDLDCSSEEELALNDTIQEQKSKDIKYDVKDEQPKPKKQKANISYDQLQQIGYKGADDLKYMKTELAAAPASGAWEWSKGEDRVDVEESIQEREQNRLAVTENLNASIQHSIKYAQRQEQLTAERKQMFKNEQKQKSQSFRQKEKRKRDLGQTNRAKNYVEEEKRVAREIEAKSKNGKQRHVK